MAVRVTPFPGYTIIIIMLQGYKDRRDFRGTPEPSGDQAPAGKGPLTFVIQKHAARQLHYDFRLEMEGVLKSWAVSKGPSLDPDIKRLAVMVEDHPLDYAGFEGSIPPGHYGAGQVIVWDKGTYLPENGEFSFDDRAGAEKLIREEMARGKLSVQLRGQKLKGSWTLVKMQGSNKNWLLIKHRDRHARTDYDVLTEETSVISGMTIEDLKSGRQPSGNKESLIPNPAEVPGATKAAFPLQLSPMLASLVATPFSKEDWLFEPKLDGFRTLACLNKGQVKLQSRGGLDVTGQYPSLIESIGKQPVSQMVLDGEIIALDSKGKSCFQCLQGYQKSFHRLRTEETETAAIIIYYIFDLIYLDGYDLRGVTLKQRKELLQKILDTDAHVRLVEYFPAEGKTVYQAAIDNGLEGIIAKRQDSLYESGRRSPHWLKIKAVKTEEFVVAGFTRGSGNRAETFGALLLGYYDDDNNLRYAGNVGSGFNNEDLISIRRRLADLKIKQSPFNPETGPIAEVEWARPELVIEVKFSEWTRDGRLRAPVFLRLREDKPVASVRRSEVIKVKDDKDRPGPIQGKSGMVGDLLEQLADKKDSLIIEVEGQRLSLTKLNKELWPETDLCRAMTKRDLITYLVQVSSILLPHLLDRPLTLSRYPDGIYGEHFFQKHYQPVPDFIQTVSLSSSDTPAREYLVCNNLATLLWLGQIADIELHTWFSRITPGPDFRADTEKAQDADFYVSYADFIILDMDPYMYSGKEEKGAEPELNREAFNQACRIAQKIRETLNALSLPSFIKTSGKTGLHIFIPVVRQLDFHAIHAAAETLCRFLAGNYPKDITLEWAVEKRAGKVFLDYNQNVRGKTLASIYSPRATPEASVSIPLRWEELDKVYPTDFTILTTPARLAETGDIWKDILINKIDLKDLLKEMKSDR